MIIDLFKMEIKRLFSATEPDIVERMKHSLSHSRLISRDDQRKFESNREMTAEERMKMEYEQQIYSDLKG